ncbi:hypothetical protein N7493_005422 [Penicillium malachiteum]|uniref:Uncharacterized protein n=1 Tax=Penicillium malachiteum TaxID=1324776 RepID=A0AAD6MWT3_9EURO|nr:hypothetical protein N7493_005422 [Penicillium malachiteum]
MSSSTSEQDPLTSESDHHEHSANLKSSDPASSAQAGAPAAVTAAASPASSRTPTSGASRRILTNEEFLANAFKALDPKKLKVDCRKLAKLCGVIQKSAGNRWGALRKKYGIIIKGFYSDEDDDDDNA